MATLSKPVQLELVLLAVQGASSESRLRTPDCAHCSALSPWPGQPPGSDCVIDWVVSRTIAMLYFCAEAPPMSALEAACTLMVGMPTIAAKIVGNATV